MRLRERWAAIGAAGREQAVKAARARSGVPELTRRDVWGSRDPAAVRAILAEAESDRDQPWPRTLLSDYARYWRDGVRTAYEGPAGELRRRTSAAVLAAALTADQAYVDQAADGLLLLCEQTTWCWAAHESFATARQEVVGDPDEPYLDLGAAETAEILAWADLVLGPALDDRVPGLRRRMRREARLRVIEPFRNDRRWHWLGLDGHLHNWNPWIHGHVLAVALFLEDDPPVQLEVTDLVVDGLSRYLDAMPADGGCDEGYAYWWNGPARLAQALDVLDRVTDGAFAPWSCTPLAELARYPHRVALGDGWYVNVADGSARPDPNQPWHVLHRWGRHHQDPEVMAQAAAHRDLPIAPAAGLGRALLGLTDDVWWNAAKADLPLPKSTWLPDVQLFVARDDSGLTLAIKGGHNDENHNHNDVGSFIAALDSTPVLIDLGQPTYTALSFSDRRYEQWVVQSAWHNVALINGHEQQAGSGHRATELVVQANSLSLRLSEAYPDASSYRRTATLDSGAITIADEWEGLATQHLVIAGAPLSHEPGRLLVETLAGGYAQLTWDPDLGAGHLEKRAVDDALLEGVWGPTVHRLVIDCTGNSFHLTVRRGERP
ncbi:heparinase II/III family protein [Kribbella sp. NPDC023972]|uniref:heparinase II/III domain-containing protein n=1 Tax=Kribbella sp. NPDC023972 TaxID=3154795 RepID=UPI0033E0F4AA